MADKRDPQTTQSSSNQDHQDPPKAEPESDGGKRQWTRAKPPIGRRSVLKLLGASAIPFAAGTATAAESGYGHDGYGVGGYGGEGDSETPDNSDGSDEPTLENTLLVDGVGSSTETEYEFRVSGNVEKSNYKGASINNRDVINDGHVVGSISGWRDAYLFGGELEELSVEGQAHVYVNGKRIDPADYGGESSQVLTIVGNGVPSQYEITVGDTIEVIEGDSVTVVSDGQAEGSIERDVHRLQFSGDLIDITFLEGGTQVYLDSTRIDPDDYNADVAHLPHVIVFDGSDATKMSSYSFTVDGDLRESTYRNATIDDGDTIDGSTARGDVAVGTADAYWFDGEISDFWLIGDADVDVEYYARR